MTLARFAFIWIIVTSTASLLIQSWICWTCFRAFNNF